MAAGFNEAHRRAPQRGRSSRARRETTAMDRRAGGRLTAGLSIRRQQPVLRASGCPRDGRDGSEDNDHRSLLICLRPRCDSVRLKEKTSFAFLPLGEHERDQMQLVVQLGKSYQRRGSSRTRQVGRSTSSNQTMAATPWRHVRKIRSEPSCSPTSTAVRTIGWAS